MMTEAEVVEQLKREGFKSVYAMDDGPGVTYDDHTHPVTVAHVIIKGEMMLTLGKEKHQLRVGDRLDIPAQAVHAAIMGPAGCRYVIGE
ncbi:MAG TPA: cupin domain-containing protein [Candidatus Paceibacterota bacterium]|nr:cupin domain-containing protein [Candidatus Paceibacterota bacterium]